MNFPPFNPEFASAESIKFSPGRSIMKSTISHSLLRSRSHAVARSVPGVPGVTVASVLINTCGRRAVSTTYLDPDLHFSLTPSTNSRLTPFQFTRSSFVSRYPSNKKYYSTMASATSFYDFKPLDSTCRKPSTTPLSPRHDPSILQHPLSTFSLPEL